MALINAHTFIENSNELSPSIETFRVWVCNSVRPLAAAAPDYLCIFPQNDSPDLRFVDPEGCYVPKMIIVTTNETLMESLGAP
jgi:hypothetical protein